MRPFRFNRFKTMQAAAYLLRREPARRMNYMRLIKLLYLAEREILAEAGKPLTGSRVIAVRRGPVLEEVLALIHGQHIATPEWARFFRTDRYHIEMIDDPGVSHLSKFVSGTLEAVAERYDQFDEWDLAEETRKLLEWRRNDPGDSSREIPLLHILEAIGRANDLDRIVAGARQDALATDFFSESGLPVQAASTTGS